MALSDSFSQVMVNRWANLVLYTEFRRKSITDLSSFSQATVVAGTGTLAWKQCGDGWAIQPPANPASGCVSAPDSVSLRLATQGTLVAFGNFGFMPTVAYIYNLLICKANATQFNYFFAYTPTIMTFYDDALIGRTLAYVVRDKRMLACSFINGSPPRFFANGAFVGVGGSNVALTAATTPVLGIGNSVAVSYSSLFPICTALIFNTQLTDAEISQLHDDWLTSGYSLR